MRTRSLVPQLFNASRGFPLEPAALLWRTLVSLWRAAFRDLGNLLTTWFDALGGSVGRVDFAPHFTGAFHVTDALVLRHPVRDAIVERVIGVGAPLRLGALPC